MTRSSAALAELLRPKMTDYVPHIPTPKQTAFLLLDDYLEVFYGGSGGGGKSEALIMAALQYVDVPGYAALLLRRSYSDLILPGALMDRVRDWLNGTDAKWNGMEKRWSFPESGASLSFGYLENPNDKYRYGSMEVQFCAFDEVTEFLESDYTFLFSRLRRLAGATVPLRMRSASNPVGRGREWVKRRFVSEGKDSSRIFLPATLEDNPYLDKRSYEKSLENLDPVTREQIRHGNWDVQAAGNLFKRYWFKRVGAAPAGLRKARFWDLAASEDRGNNDPSWTAGVLIGERDGEFYILDAVRIRATPRNVEDLVRNTAEMDGPDVMIGMEREGGSSGVTVVGHYSKILNHRQFRGYPASKKETRFNNLSSQCEAGNVFYVDDLWNEDFLSEMELIPGGGHDDQAVAAAGAFFMLTERQPIDMSQVSIVGQERIGSQFDW